MSNIIAFAWTLEPTDFPPWVYISVLTLNMAAAVFIVGLLYYNRKARK